MALRFMEGEAELGSHLALAWDNGRRQRLGAAFLRAQCPCENCKLAPIKLEAQMFPGLRIDEAVPVPVLTTALYERFTSRGEADYQDKLLSAMRFEFGGHLEKSAAKRG